MDVHDTSSVPRSTPFEHGMVVTIEPGELSQLDAFILWKWIFIPTICTNKRLYVNTYVPTSNTLPIYSINTIAKWSGALDRERDSLRVGSRERRFESHLR